MDFVLTLHSHIPYVLNHGRRPHGSDWLCEATLDTYLPLLEILMDLRRKGIPSPITLGITPVLANQLASPVFREEMDGFFRQCLGACDEAPASLMKSGDPHLLPLVDFWRARFLRLRRLFDDLDGDLLSAFRRLEEEERIEIITSAATHGLLPLLGREESIQLQLIVGFFEHRRLFGVQPRGCWVPECAYRPEGVWNPIPGTSRERLRPGLERHLTEVGFRYFFLDTHMAEAGEALGWCENIPHGTERFGTQFAGDGRAEDLEPRRSAYRAYLVGDSETGRNVAAFVRGPEASLQIWSRSLGYPGEGSYLDVHKVLRPGALKYWSVAGSDVDLGETTPYDPKRASHRASDHATHFAGFLGHIQRKEKVGVSGVTMAPFNTELFGGWWFEGIDFLHELFTRLPFREGVSPVTASQHLDAAPPEEVVRPVQGSWGPNGDFSMWSANEAHWTWKRLWPLEDRFWEAAPRALESEQARPILAQAARQLLLAQSSDWQFMISTGAVPDYAERRLKLHVDEAEGLLKTLDPGASDEASAEAFKRVAELQVRDDLFPDILDSVQRVLEGT